MNLPAGMSGCAGYGGRLIRGRMYRTILVLVTAMALVIMADLPVRAAEARVFDEYGVLSETEKTELDQRISEIKARFHFDTAFLIMGNIDESWDYRRLAADFMQLNDIGYGRSRNGMCVLHQPDVRNITIVFRGEIQDAFTVKIQDIILDNCTEKLKDDDTYEAYMTILDDVETGLERTEAGKKIRPVDLSRMPRALEILKWILISFGAAAVPALLLTWYQRRRMITLIPQTNADAYREKEGLELQEARDMFLYRTVTRTRKPDKQDFHGGPSGSFTHGGETFSGSSRNY